MRTLFVLMTLVCVVIGTWAVYVNPYRRQLASLAVVNRLQGNSARAPADGPQWQRWLVTTFLGREAFVQVTDVHLNGKEVNDESLRALGGLTELRKLSLDYTPITDEGIAVVRSMPKLQDLSLRYTKITDRGAAEIGALPNLRTAHLTGTKITDSGIEDLEKLRSANELYIRWTGISNEGAARLAARLPDCDIFHHALVTP